VFGLVGAAGLEPATVCGTAFVPRKTRFVTPFSSFVTFQFHAVSGVRSLVHGDPDHMKKLVVSIALSLLVSTIAIAQVNPTPVTNPPDDPNPGTCCYGGGTSAPNLSFHGGSVVQNAKMTYIFWGWASGGGVGSGEYTSDLIGSRRYSMPNHMGMLAQYNATQSAGLLNSGVPDVYDASAPAANITDLDVQHEVQKYFHNQVDPWNIYVVVLPPGVQVTAPDGTVSCNASGGRFGGYHADFWDPETWGNVRARYAVVPYPECPSGRPAGWSDAMTAEQFVLHEVRETMTDPHKDGWYDIYGQEADDKCQTLTFTEFAPAPPPYYNRVFSFGLQQEWSNAAHGCVQ